MPKYIIKHGKYRSLDGTVFKAGQEVELNANVAERFPDMFVAAKVQEVKKVEKVEGETIKTEVEAKVEAKVEGIEKAEVALETKVAKAPIQKAAK